MKGVERPRATSILDSNLAGGKFEKVLVGATRAVYGDGAQIEDLFTGEQSQRFVIENLSQKCNTEIVRSAIEQNFGSVMDLKIIEGMERCTAIITMSTIQEAEQAIGVLKVDIPQVIKGRRRLSVYGIPEAFESQKAQLSSTIEICCHYPSRLAWTHYGSEWDARLNAKRLNETLFDGRTLICRFQEPVYSYRGHRHASFNVTIANLPENVREQHLLRRTKANDVTINDLLFTTTQVKRHLAEVLPLYGALVSWEMSPVRPGANKLYAFARYSSVQESRNALDSLSTGSQRSIKFYASLVKSMKYSVRNDLWQILEQHVRVVINDNNGAAIDPASSVRLSLYDVESTHANRKFRIYGKDIKALGKVKVAIDNLV